VLLDAYLHPPDRKVIDYRSDVTGLSEEKLQEMQPMTSLEQVQVRGWVLSVCLWRFRRGIQGCSCSMTGLPCPAQAALCRVIGADTVVVGHSLQHDFQALHIVHHRTIDTALLFQLENTDRHLLSLKDIVHEVLQQSCQPRAQAHGK
jgi:hypothetical protein